MYLTKGPRKWSTSDSQLASPGADEMLETNQDLPENGLFNKIKLAEILKSPLKIAETALKSLKAAGYTHDDVAWRHVALLPVRESKGQSKSNMVFHPILIDLTGVVKRDSVDSVTRGLEILQDELLKNEIL